MHTISRLRNEKGFTLIELLIVIVVLGILAAIVLFAVGTTRDDAEESACKADVKTTQTALEGYKAKIGGYPAASSGAGWTQLQAEGFIRPPFPDSVTFNAAGATVPATTAGCEA